MDVRQRPRGPILVVGGRVEYRKVNAYLLRINNYSEETKKMAPVARFATPLWYSPRNMTTLSDIAKDLKVSVVTVSKALRNQGRISVCTRNRVLKRAKEL